MACPNYCTGDLKHPVVIERGTDIDDGSGGTYAEWAVVETVYCAIKQKSGAEKFQQQDIRTVKTKSFITRYGADVTELDRLVFNGQYYNVRSVEDIDERNMWLEIIAEVGVVDRGTI